jgi:hypothetical protein
VDIHQIQVKYDPVQDRLLMQVRTRDDQLFGLWLTRRMVMRMWPPVRQLMTAIAVDRSAPGAMAVPEAREMLAQAARERALKSTDFKTQFNPAATKLPLGAEPMLPAAIDLRKAPRGAIVLAIRDAQGRSLELQLGEDLANGWMKLIENALAQSDWGIEITPRAPESAPTEPPSRVLN